MRHFRHIFIFMVVFVFGTAVIHSLVTEFDDAFGTNGLVTARQVISMPTKWLCKTMAKLWLLLLAAPCSGTSQMARLITVSGQQGLQSW